MCGPVRPHQPPPPPSYPSPYRSPYGTRRHLLHARASVSYRNVSGQARPPARPRGRGRPSLLPDPVARPPTGERAAVQPGWARAARAGADPARRASAPQAAFHEARRCEERERAAAGGAARRARLAITRMVHDVHVREKAAHARIVPPEQAPPRAAAPPCPPAPRRAPPGAALALRFRRLKRGCARRRGTGRISLPRGSPRRGSASPRTRGRTRRARSRHSARSWSSPRGCCRASEAPRALKSGQIRARRALKSGRVRAPRAPPNTVRFRACGEYTPARLRYLAVYFRRRR
jgi:hypothetical protein